MFTRLPATLAFLALVFVSAGLPCLMMNQGDMWGSMGSCATRESAESEALCQASGFGTTFRVASTDSPSNHVAGIVSVGALGAAPHLSTVSVLDVRVRPISPPSAAPIPSFIRFGALLL